MPTQKKIDTVTDLTEKLARAKSVMLTDYRGLKHKQMEELRGALKKANADFMVAKNRLFLRALGSKAKSLKEYLKDTTAILFSYADGVAPLKELVKYFKAAGVGKTKIGLVEGRMLLEDDLLRLSTLPTRDVLLSQLARQLNAPIQGLHYTLSRNVRRLLYALQQIQKSKSK